MDSRARHKKPFDQKKLKMVKTLRTRRCYIIRGVSAAFMGFLTLNFLTRRLIKRFAKPMVDKRAHTQSVALINLRFSS